MCTYIVLTFPTGTRLEALEPILKQHGRACEPLDNSHLARQLGPAQFPVFTTEDHCDCGTALGSEVEDPSVVRRQARSDERRLKRFRRHGWTETKIRRWLAEKEAHETRHREASGDDLELDTWLSLLNDLLDSKATPRVGVLLHFFDKPVSEEEIVLGARDQVPLKRLNRDLLLTLKEDVLYDFVRS